MPAIHFIVYRQILRKCVCLPHIHAMGLPEEKGKVYTEFSEFLVPRQPWIGYMDVILFHFNE